MKAGILKTKINIYSPKTIKSQFGESKTEWNITYQTRANVKTEAQNRTTVNNEIFYATTVQFTVRDYVPVNEWDRIEYNNKFYRVLSVIRDENVRQTKIITELIND